jgi:hypothetical protein
MLLRLAMMRFAESLIELKKQIGVMRRALADAGIA